MQLTGQVGGRYWYRVQAVGHADDAGAWMHMHTTCACITRTLVHKLWELSFVYFFTFHCTIFLSQNFFASLTCMITYLLVSFANAEQYQNVEDLEFDKNVKIKLKFL